MAENLSPMSDLASDVELLLENLSKHHHRMPPSTSKKKVKPEDTLTYKLLSDWMPAGYEEFGPGTIPLLPKVISPLVSLLLSPDYREWIIVERHRKAWAESHIIQGLEGGNDSDQLLNHDADLLVEIPFDAITDLALTLQNETHEHVATSAM
ncbi:MAG: hypothetical protein WC749_05245 [Dehalococcoidia bacterium]